MCRGIQGVWTRLVRVVLASVVVATLSGVSDEAAAQFPGQWERTTIDQPGLEQAIGRYYLGPGEALLGAFVSSFASDADAIAAFEAITATQTDASWLESAVDIEGLGPHTRAYASQSQITGNQADILTVDGRYLYITAVGSFDASVESLAITTATVLAMIAAEVDDSPGAFDEAGTSSGGLWDKLPPGDGLDPPGFWQQYDVQVFPVPEEPEAGQVGAIDFGAFAGIERVVARSYIGDTTVLETPETAPAATYAMAVEIATFETAEHAMDAVESIHAQTITYVTDEFSVTLESIDPRDFGDLGDQVLVDAGTMEEDGITLELTTVIVQDGAYVYLVLAVGVGADSGVVETATGVVEPIIAAEAGSGDGEFDETGHSHGGLWDKFPDDGDDVLAGLVPEGDLEVYP